MKPKHLEPDAAHDVRQVSTWRSAMPMISSRGDHRQRPCACQDVSSGSRSLTLADVITELAQGGGW